MHIHRPLGWGLRHGRDSIPKRYRIEIGDIREALGSGYLANNQSSQRFVIHQ